MSSASTVEKYMQAMAEGFQSSRARGLEVIYEFRLTGAGGGTWTISVVDGKCDVDQGTPPRADTTVTMGTAQYLKLAAGELDAVDAYNKGQIKVSGSLDHARKFIELFPPWASRVAPDVQPEPAQPPWPITYGRYRRDFGLTEQARCELSISFDWPAMGEPSGP